MYNLTVLMKHIKEATVNDVIAEDIVHNNLLIVKRGTIITERLKELLIKRNIKRVKILERTENGIQDLFEIEKIMVNEKVNETFLQVLSKIGSENRYGKLLNDTGNLQFVKKLFKLFHLNQPVIKLFYDLRTWDNYSFVHSFDVFMIGSLLARKNDVKDIELVGLGYLVHDIGKLKIPKEILDKTGKLNYSEFNTIKNHTIAGEKLLVDAGAKNIAHFARSHHERIDGSGYPDKLFEKNLTKALKILHIVDVYSALTLKRTYKEPIPGSSALQILFQNKHLYDEKLLLSFVELLNIYPSESIVLLSDNSQAIVEKNNTFRPVTNIKQTNLVGSASLPLSHTATVTKLLSAKTNPFQLDYNKFIHRLLNGEYESAVSVFNTLIDGFRLEDVYAKLLLPTYLELNESYQSSPDYKVAIARFHMLINLHFTEMKRVNDFNNNILLYVDKRVEQSTILKLLQNLLLVEKVLPTVKEFNEGISHIEQYNKNKYCIILNENQYKKSTYNFSHVQHKQSFKSIGHIKQIVTNLDHSNESSFHIYNKLMY